MDKFKKIDEGLKIYYTSVGINDYTNADNIGKFLQYCIDNELDEDDIDDNLAGDPSDSIFIDFDDNFPYKENLKFDDDKHDDENKHDDEETKLNKQILRIIKCIVDNGMPPKLTTDVIFNFNDLELNQFQLTPDEYKKYKNIYSKQCSLIFVGNLDGA
eukprot:314961_1